MGAVKQFMRGTLDDKGHQVSIITTNYDVVVEYALAALGKSAQLPFESNSVGGGKHETYQDLYAKDGVPLMKLHGSVNWFFHTNPPDLVLVDQRLAKGEYGVPYPVCSHNDFVPPGEEFIVPPTYSKGFPKGPIDQIWAAAARALSEAELLAFVGYSFPGSDTEMRYFLGRSLAGNSRIRRIALIDPDAAAIAIRLRAAKSGYGEHFGDLLYTDSSQSWSDTGLPIDRV
jgi:hypothetical protein